jgi:hypothetical protein
LKDDSTTNSVSLAPDRGYISCSVSLLIFIHVMSLPLGVI